MSKPVKDLITKELAARYSQMDSVVVIDPIGLTGIESNQLRGGLHSKNIHLEVVNNSLAKRALVDSPAATVGELLDGSRALVTGGDSVVEIAREIVDWCKKLKGLKVRGALVEGQIMDAEGVQMLATLPTRIELQGQVVALAQSPGARLASAIEAPAARIAGCIEALAEKLAGSSETEAA